MAVIGKRGTGKSFFVRDLCFHFQDVPRIIVFSGSERYNKYFSHFVPPKNIYYEFKLEVLEQLRDEQERRIDEWEKDHMKDPRVIVILDDCMWDDAFTRQPLMQFLFFNGRHLRIMLIITMQDPIGLPPKMRGNTDYVFLMNEPNPKNRDKIHNNFAQSVIYHRTEFDRIMNLMTNDKNIMVLDNAVSSNNMSDRLFYFLAKERTNFRCGDPVLWNEQKSERNPYKQGITKPYRNNVQINLERRGTQPPGGYHQPPQQQPQQQLGYGGLSYPTNRYAPYGAARH